MSRVSQPTQPPSKRLRGSATYRAAGVPDLVLVLDEIVTFAGDRIVHLEDRYDDAMKAELEAYAVEHRDALGLALDRRDGFQIIRSRGEQTAP